MAIEKEKNKNHKDLNERASAMVESSKRANVHTHFRALGQPLDPFEGTRKIFSIILSQSIREYLTRIKQTLKRHAPILFMKQALVQEQQSKHDPLMDLKSFAKKRKVENKDSKQVDPQLENQNTQNKANEEKEKENYT